MSPDYEACHPPVLMPPQTITVTGTNCGNAPAGSGVGTINPPSYAFNVFAIDAEVGKTYTFSGVGLFDADGDAAGFDKVGTNGYRITRAGRYYIVITGTSVAVTVS